MLSLFADDTSILLDGSDESLNETLSELSKFARISGLNVNFDKTHVVWLGKKKYSPDSIKTRYKLKWGTQKFKLLGITFHVDLDKMITLNYTDKIKSLRSTITHWKRRYISPIGKITIIKSLLLPMFIHLFVSLPNPETHMLKEINDILFNFLWNGPAKIKKSVVTNDYSGGGLRMINTLNFIQSLKCTWIRRIINTSGTWIHLTQDIFDIKKLVNCGKYYSDTVSKKTTNTFWKDVLNAYSNLITSTKITNTSDVLMCPLFYNHNILIGNNSVFIKSWYDKGIRYINDLIQDGRFLTENEIFDLYKIRVNYLQYHGLKIAIKKYINSVHKDSFQTISKCKTPFIPYHFQVILKSRSGSRMIYDKLNKNSDIPTSKIKWNASFNFTDIQWKRFYSSPFTTTNDTNIQWFQSQILHRILPLNKYLKTIGLKDNDLCTFCKRDSETILHLFTECEITKSFLDSVRNALQRQHLHISIDKETTIFGTDDIQTSLTTIYLKNYIYLGRNRNLNLN